jgi:hypothetical protein
VAFADAFQKIMTKNTHINEPGGISVVDHGGKCVKIVLTGAKNRVIPRAWAIAVR